MEVPKVEFRAELLVDGVLEGRVSSFTLEGLEEELSKLEYISDRMEEISG